MKQGEVIVIPTDTIYGFAAREESVQKIFELKKRSPSNRLVLFVDKIASLDSFIGEIPRGGKELMEAHWPGPLTLVLPSKSGDTIAIRIPDHALILSLLKQTGPLFVTSANISGELPLLTSAAIEETFGKEFPILEGYVPTQGLASTILSYKEGFWEVDRQGALTKFAVHAKIRESLKI